MRKLLLSLLCLVCSFYGFAVGITGDIRDVSGRERIGGVTVYNVHTNKGAVSDSNGVFSIEASKGEMLEFRKMGYKTARVRLPDGQIPSYFRIVLHPGPIELPGFEIAGKAKTYKEDSLRYYKLYKHVLEFPELKGYEKIKHPFSALSKTNRQKWAFQKEYEYFQEQKFIDYYFNERMIEDLTGLKGDSVARYIKRYRPSYDQIRSMNEYQFYMYVKESVYVFRHGPRYTPSIRRSAN